MPARRPGPDAAGPDRLPPLPDRGAVQTVLPRDHRGLDRPCGPARRSGQEAATLTRDLSDGVGNPRRQVGQTTRDARATDTELEHPLAAVGTAAGLGLLHAPVA